ncbi:hypothetical protein EU534_02110 [Candidatus Heimdallarchaeota archaeon]|nr:MAG: hypothetical protein EU534_02110 [Candidatus Heimdallarchaeota archaeon]
MRNLKPIISTTKLWFILVSPQSERLNQTFRMFYLEVSERRELCVSLKDQHPWVVKKMRSDNYPKLILKLCLSLLLATSILSPIHSNAKIGDKVSDGTATEINAYLTSGIIINDTNIASYSSTGTGSIDDPYIIDNLMINTTDSLGVKFDGVSSGTYYTLRDSHIIGNTYGVYISDITSGKVKVINCTLEGSLGIGGANALYLTIDNCTLKFNQAPSFREGVKFTNNVVYYRATAYSGSIMNIRNENNIVENNIFYGNYSSFIVGRVTNTTVRNNILHKTGFSFSDDDLEDIVNNTFENNMIDGRPFGFLMNISDETISGELYGQIYLAGSENIIIEKQYLTNINLAIQVYNCTNITLKEIESTTKNGIEIEDTVDIKIENSVLEGFGYGLDFENSRDITIVKNHLTGFEYGIEISYGEDVHIHNNTLLQLGEYGLYFDNVSDCEMTFNIFTINIQEPGSDLLFGSWELGYAKIYYNVFINYGNASAQLFDVYSSTNVTWYDETLEIGNFYSNWNGTGTYFIPGDGAIDLYPFIDVDKDLLTEIEEVLIYHTNPFQADSDGDGFDDYTEILEGTDPLNPKDYPGKGVVLAVVLGSVFGVALIAAALYILNKRGLINLSFLKKK